MCNRLRTRPGWVEPEVYFRIFHVAGDGHNDAPVGAFREQTIEYALDSKGEFENANIGVLRRWVPPDKVICAVLPRQGIRKPPKKPRIPRVVELLREALMWQAFLESGQIASQADIARREGVTRARVTQVMSLLRLAPEIQQRILPIPKMVSRSPISERMLRPIETIADYHTQIQEFHKLSS